MNVQEYRHLQAERSALESLLQDIPESCVIDRMSLESRMNEVTELLASQPIPVREPVRARLTFRGKPIVGSYGMFAEFGAKAINAFADAVAAIGASQTNILGTRGAIPNRDEYQLLITGTAIGSFGFEIEEASKDNMVLPEKSLVESALEQTKRIMEASLGTDDELSEAISEANPRAIDSLQLFLKTIADEEAICTLEFKDESFRFIDVDQVRRSMGRLSQDNIHEEEKIYTGRFLGALPIHRTFEFQVSESTDVIFGKISSEIENVDDLNHLLDRRVKIKVQSKQVGTGKPRYVLLNVEEMDCNQSI